MGRPKGKTKHTFHTGQTFGEWIVVKYVSDTSPPKVHVKCVCGTERVVDGYSLVHNRSTNCGCKRSKLHITNTTITRAINKAHRHGTSLTPEYLTELFVSQNSRCAITGELLDGSGASLSVYTPANGYTVGNVMWVSNAVSPLTNKLGVEATLTTAKHITNTATATPNIFHRLGFTKEK